MTYRTINIFSRTREAAPEATPNMLRRDTLGGAIGFAGLAAISVAGIAKPDYITASPPTNHPDAILLTACTAFAAAHKAQERDNARSEGSDAETALIGRDWYAALDAVTAAPRPQTEAGRIALARAGYVALLDEITGNGSIGVSDWASREEILALAALDAMQGAGA